MGGVSEPDDAAILDMAAVAARLGVDPATIRRYRVAGKLPAPDVMLGRSPGWRVSTIDAWVAGRPGRGAGAGRPRKQAAEGGAS